MYWIESLSIEISMVYKTDFPPTANGFKPLLRFCLLASAMAGLLVLAHSSQAQARFYRYVNEQGVRVMSSTIPPEYAQKGYEILGPNGQVLRTVDPAPEPEDLERVEKERALQAEYEVLARRYSSAQDIISARDRRLAHLDANIAILRGNINSINNQLEQLMSRAANFEREGREVPRSVFNDIDKVRDELRSTEEMLQIRLQEHEEIYARFERDVELFEQGRALQEARQSAAPDRNR